MNASLALNLTDFMPNGVDHVDFWAVCWHYKGTFKSDWQAFRTRKDRSLETTSAAIPVAIGSTVKVCIQVIDAHANEFRNIVEVYIPPP